MNDSLSSVKLGIIGLGKMGGPIARKLSKSAQVIVYDSNQTLSQEFKDEGFAVAETVTQLGALCNVIWLMIPASVVDAVLKELFQSIKKGTTIIDGGNSYYEDSMRHAQECAARGVHFLDCGTSGGLYGAEHGLSLTIGGDKEIFESLRPLFNQLAASHSAYLYIGPSGSGHYVKMVHNGIEYALLEAYAEGFHLLHNGYYKDLDLAAISKVWLEGSIIRSWILQLIYEILKTDQEFTCVRGSIGETGTGKWTVEEAHRRKVPVRLIEDALAIRAESRVTGGNYATKLVALIRHEMGGHSFEQEACSVCQE